MPLAKDDEKNVIRFLLGEMAEGERSQFEERLVDDDEVFEFVLATEAELIDEYASGGLSAPQRESVQRNLLATPGGKDRLHFAQALASRQGTNAQNREDEVAAPGFLIRLANWLGAHRAITAAGLAAAALAIVAGIWWMSTGQRHGIPQPEQAGEEPPISHPVPQPPEPSRAGTEPGVPDVPKEPKPPTEHPPPSPVPTTSVQRDVVVFAFALQTTRNVEELRVLQVPRTARTVRLELALAADQTARCTAVLKTADGRTVLSQAGLSPRPAGAHKRRVTVDLPANRLGAEEYVLTLTGAGPSDVIADYIFRVAFQ